jgi:hypothetical protein
MSKSKRARSIKPRSASKNLSKAASRKRAAFHHGRRANSKKARVLELLRGPSATIATIMESTGLAVALGAAVLCERGPQEARPYVDIGKTH